MAEVELRFPSTPLLWLKDLAAFLNKRLEHTPESPNLAEHPTGEHPTLSETQQIVSADIGGLQRKNEKDGDRVAEKYCRQ